MTDFFERQNIAKRKTQILLLYLLPAVALTVLAVYLVFALAFSKHHFSPKLFFGVTEVSLMIIVGGSLVKVWSLRAGGAAIASMVGARPVSPETFDSDERKFRDVVEEMSIASGIPVPQLFVLQKERGINAFAAGHSTSDAAIVVTRGALQLLTRDELQAVIAHEFSHICNGDMSLNMWLLGVTYGILCIALLGKLAVRIAWEGDFDRATAGLAALGSAIFLVGSIGYFFGSLIKFAVSRQREYLADAAAVQFTRNPLALAGALKKIGGLEKGSDILAPSAAEISQLFFADAATTWFSTHPPLEARIKLLDSSFDGKFPTVTALPEPEAQSYFSRVTATSALTSAVRIKQKSRGPEHLTYAAGLNASFAPEITSAAHEPFGAGALVYAMLLMPDPTARNKQLTEVQAIAEAPLLNAAQQYFNTVCGMSNGQKLALINIAMPALRMMSALQFESFCKTVQALVESDSEISLFEYSIQKILFRHLEPTFKKSKPPIAQYYGVAGLALECAVLLSALAYESSEDCGAVATAFQCGADQLDLPDNKPLSLLSLTDCNLQRIDAALAKISLAAMPVKKSIVNACAMVVAADCVVKDSEAEMLRAVADAIDCPLPPFVNAIGIAEAA